MCSESGYIDYFGAREKKTTTTQSVNRFGERVTSGWSGLDVKKKKEKERIIDEIYKGGENTVRQSLDFHGSLINFLCV